LSWESQFVNATRSFEWPRVAELANGYVEHLRNTSEYVSATEAKSILALLRENLRSNELLRVADALLGHGVEDAAVKRQFAQALVDRDSPAASLLIFRTLVADPGVSEGERAEAQGGVGRCYKQMYVLNTAGGLRSRYLQLALAAYRKAYDQDHGRIWHGINVVALLWRADREGIGLPDVVDAGTAARNLAEEILLRVESDPDPDAWAQATACEACIALGRHDEAVEWAARFASDRDADAFKIAAVLRQLIEIWQLDTAGPPGDAVLPVMRSALLDQNGGAVAVATQDVRATRLRQAVDPKLEKVLGAERFQTLTWYRTGLQRCRAVARIQNLNEQGIGTGFLIDGSALHPALPKNVLATNGHVVPEMLDPRNAVVDFRGLDEDQDSRQRFRVVRRWWYEPSRTPGLDTTLLELEDFPRHVTPIPPAAALPRLDSDPPPRAYLIGHPGGQAQPQFTIQDNLLLDYDDSRVHYRSPTEPGSSGSPVFDDQWQLIALHHGGGFEIPRLNSKGGTYPANEGISVWAIIDGLERRPPVAEEIVV
jgi:V8-like Glu-specific endopeptidase